MRAAWGAVGAGLLAGTVALAAPLFQEGALVATSEKVEVRSLALDPLGDLRVAGASAIAVSTDGTTWVLGGGDRRLRSFSPDGVLLTDTLLPSEEDDEEGEDDEEDEGEDDDGEGEDEDAEEEAESHDDDDSAEDVALAVLPDGVAVAIEEEVFFLSAAGDVTSRRTLPEDVVAAGVHGDRVWVAHEEGIVGFERGAPVANHSFGSREVVDLSVAASGDLWVLLDGKGEIRVLSPGGALLRSRAIEADLVSTTTHDGGAWIAAGCRLTRLDAALKTVATAPAFPHPSKIVSLAADPRGVVFAATKKRIRSIGPSGELRSDAAFQGNARVKAKAALALRLDRVAPTLVFRSPRLLSPVACTNDARVPLVVAFEDAGTGPNRASLAFFTARGLLPTTCTFLGGLASCTPSGPGIPDGTIAVSATIEDFASVPNVSLPATTTFRVDTRAPVIQLAAGAPPPALTNVATLSFGGTLSEPADLTLNGAPVPVTEALTWSVTVTLVEGTNVFDLVARDCPLNAGHLSFVTILDVTPPAPPEDGLIFVSESSVDGLVQILGDPGCCGEPGSTVVVTNLVTGFQVRVVLDALGAFRIDSFQALGGHAISIHVVDRAGNSGTSISKSVPERPGEEPTPIDPSLVAPPLDPSLASTDFFAATSFLFTGPDPIQTGVAPGEISPERIIVLRGRVLDRAGLPVAGARISFTGNVALGETRSRADGAFDVAANGGGDGLLLSYTAPGFLEVQRRAVGTPWRDYVILPDVILTAVDPASSAIDLSGSAAGWQVHLGSPVTDDRGFRRNAVLFPPAVMGDLTWKDGRREPLFLAHVHSTEFTVGPDREKAMPGELPPSSLITWSCEYSTEEERDSDSLVFSQNVFSWLLDDFLLVEPGTPIPLGSWDRNVGAWVPEENGLAVRLLGVSNGLAQVDVDGSGVAASEAALAALGITPGEREQVAALFPVSAILWRMPRAHFSESLDGNFGRGLTRDAKPLGAATPVPTATGTCPLNGNSVVCAQTQMLRESIPVAGAPSLNWTSQRAFGREHARAVDVAVSGPTVPASLRSIRVTLAVAGRSITQTFPPLPNQNTRIVWDGLDGYGRLVQGEVPAKLVVGARYPLVYGLPVVPVANAPMFAQPGTQVLLIGRGLSNPSGEVTREFDLSLGYSDARGAGLAGWTLSPHHQFDPARGTLLLGTGERRAASDVNAVTSVVAGTGVSAPPLFFCDMADLATAPDGSIFVIACNGQVWKLPPGGSPTLFAGGVGGPSGAGDGGPAVLAALNDPRALAVGPDGSVFIGERGGSRIRRVRRDGIIETFAGTGVPGHSGDGGFATGARLTEVSDLVVAPDGSVYFSDAPRGRVRRIGPDGRIWPWAGNGESNFGGVPLGDGGPATRAILTDPQGLALAPDGTVLIADNGNWRIRAVGSDGIIRTVAGGGELLHCEGCPATTARELFPQRVGVRPDGTILFTTPRNNAFDPAPGPRIRQISPNGRVTTLNDSSRFANCHGPEAEAQRAMGATCLDGVNSLETLPDGTLLLGQSYGGRNVVRRVAPVLAGFRTADSVVPSADASQLYVFDREGRHLETRDALTGVTQMTFGYDRAGRISDLTDVSGNVTRVQRDPRGEPTAIVAPGGRRTSFTVDLDGYLTSVANDAGETFSLLVGAGGLIDEFRKPRGNATHYAWDRGFLTRWEDAAGGFQTLTRTHVDGQLSLEHRRAEGRVTTFRIEGAAASSAGEQRRNTFPDGTTAEEVRGSDESVTVTRADGMLYQTHREPDPRFGMEAAFAASSLTRTPSGLSLAVQRTRSVVSPLGDVLAPPTSATDTVTVGATGRTWTSTYDAGPPRTRRSVSPEGRTSVATLDALGRVIRSQNATLAPVSLVYRPDGLLESTVQGEFPNARASSMTYNARRELSSITDPLGRTTSFQRDLAGRVTRQVLPDGRQILTRYDSNGNVVAVTPPSRPEHRFAYTPVDLEQSYDPPDVAGATPGMTSYEYDLDKRLLRAVRPDGATVNLSYRAAGGKLSAIAHAASTTSYLYEPGTGRLGSMSESATGSSLTYAYDGTLVLSETMSGPVGGQVSRAYDGDFRVREERVNGLYPVAVTYDRDSLPTQVGDLLLSRNPATGLVDGTVLGAVSTGRTTNAFAEPIAESAHVGAAQVLAFSYDRDALGRITALRERIGGIETQRAFNYDSVGRLTDVRVGGFEVASWTYDGNSNRISARTGSGRAVTAEYDEQDRLLRYGDATFTYTANGELATRTELGSTTTYAYDAVGNLRHVDLPDGRAIDYLIDARNRRVGKKINGILVQGWLYRDQLEPVAELDGAGNVVARFVYATKGHSPDYMLRDGRTYRILSDHLGSPRLVIDVDSGAIVQRMDFDEWGVVTLDTNPGWQPFGFAGGLLDLDTGLTRFGARDYAAAEGRWTAKDPIGFGGGDTGLYGYVMGDPINFVDPSGLQRTYFPPAPDCNPVDPADVCEWEPATVQPSLFEEDYAYAVVGGAMNVALAATAGAAITCYYGAPVVTYFICIEAYVTAQQHCLREMGGSPEFCQDFAIRVFNSCMLGVGAFR